MSTTKSEPILLQTMLGDPSAQDRRSLLSRLRDIDEALWSHARAVAVLVEQVANLLTDVELDRQALIDAAWFHDIGKLVVPPQILLEPGPLDERGWQLVRQHPDTGAVFLASCWELEPAAQMVRHHHERYDGGGYPDGLASFRIPMGARIIGVADAFQAMTSARPYRPQRSRDEAIEELQRCAGTQFDPNLVDTFMRMHSNQEGHSR